MLHTYNSCSESELYDPVPLWLMSQRWPIFVFLLFPMTGVEMDKIFVQFLTQKKSSALLFFFYKFIRAKIRFPNSRFFFLQIHPAKFPHSRNFYQILPFQKTQYPSNNCFVDVLQFSPCQSLKRVHMSVLKQFTRTSNHKWKFFFLLTRHAEPDLFIFHNANRHIFYRLWVWLKMHQAYRHDLNTLEDFFFSFTIGKEVKMCHMLAWWASECVMAWLLIIDGYALMH